MRYLHTTPPRQDVSVGFRRSLLYPISRRENTQLLSRLLFVFCAKFALQLCHTCVNLASTADRSFSFLTSFGCFPRLFSLLLPQPHFERASLPRQATIGSLLERPGLCLLLLTAIWLSCPCLSRGLLGGKRGGVRSDGELQGKVVVEFVGFAFVCRIAGYVALRSKFIL